MSFVYGCIRQLGRLERGRGSVVKGAVASGVCVRVDFGRGVSMAAASEERNTEPSIFIDEVRGHQARYKKILEFTHSATKSAGIMLLAAIAALVIANTGAYEAF